MGTDKDIFSSTADGEVLGMYKTLVFYKGRWPRGQKTTWFMQEYRRLPADGTKVSPSTSSMMVRTTYTPPAVKLNRCIASLHENHI